MELIDFDTWERFCSETGSDPFVIPNGVVVLPASEERMRAAAVRLGFKQKPAEPVA